MPLIGNREECKENRKEIIELLSKINDLDTYKCAVAERNVLKVLEGDCETAVGVYASLNSNEITLEAELFSLDGSQRFFEKMTSSIKYFDKLGLDIGKILRQKSKGVYKK